MRRPPRIAILIDDLYQDLEVWYPYYRLREAGAVPVLVGAERKAYTGKYGYPAVADVSAARITARGLAGLIVPGGYAPDYLRRVPAVLRLVRAIDRQRKPLGAICHAGWVLCSADVLRGRTITCFSAIRDDVVNAGARYVDRAVVRDGHVVTARKPDDLPAFMKEFLRGLERAAEGSRRQRRQEGLRGARQHNRPNRRAVL